MEKREILKETELFVLDMDGTFYLDTDVLDGALDFLEEVKKAGKRYVFFTNNSSKSPKTYIDKLAKMGCYIKRNQIITSGDVMIQYLKEYYPEKKVYLVGTPDLEENFRENGILLTREMPDVIVIGFDMTLTYEKLDVYPQRRCVPGNASGYQLPDEGWFYPGLRRNVRGNLLIDRKGAEVCRKTIQGDRGYGSGDDRGKARGNVVCRRPDLHGCENRRGKWGTRNPGADRRDEAGGCTEGGCRAGCDFHRAERDGRNTQDYERRGSIE